MKNSGIPNTAGKVWLFSGALLCILVVSSNWAGAMNGEFFNPALPVLTTGNDAIDHCGCDDRKEVEKYAQNIINDAKQRGLTCDQSKLHAFACITGYCSICKDHPEMMERCIANASSYFLNSADLCGQEKSHILGFTGGMR